MTRLPADWTLTRRAGVDAPLLVAYPTVPGREDDAARLDAAIAAQRVEEGGPRFPADVLRMEGYATCGEAWNDAAAWAASEGYRFVVLAADDLEPAEGCLAAAAGALAMGWSPSALIVTAETDAVESHGDWGRIYPGEGNTPVSMTRIPAVRVEWWRRIPPIHYYSDNAVTTVLRHLDVPILASRGFAWRHYWAQAGRISGVGEQAAQERDAYTIFERETITTNGRNLL